MTQNEIAEATGFAQSYIHYVLKCDRIPSIKNAIKLEEATGICREAWSYPERHWNPYIPFSKSSVCGSCNNRVSRTRKANEICLEHFKKAKDKRKAFNDLIKIKGIIHGHTAGQLVVFREIFPDKLVLLGAGDNLRHGHSVLKGPRWQGLIDAVQERGVYSVPHWPHDIPDDTNPSSLMLYIEDPKSYHRISSGRHIVEFIISSQFTMEFSPEVLAALQEYNDELDAIWHETYPD